MIVKNNTQKVINIGTTPLMPDETMEVSQAVASAPSIKAMAEKGQLSLIDPKKASKKDEDAAKKAAEDAAKKAAEEEAKRKAEEEAAAKAAAEEAAKKAAEEEAAKKAAKAGKGDKTDK